MSKRFLRNTKGQAALFVVLIFQVLFILFAMSLNVALVVHDKINFQNSLDLAAYYGAKKQAEVLNAMAHINYQMRQNWKLLAWRYRILGTLAQKDGRYADRGSPDFWCPQNTRKSINCGISRITDDNIRSACEGAESALRGLYPGYCDRNFFVCISNDLWKRGIQATKQNLCTKQDIPIPDIRTTPVFPGPLAGTLRNVNSQLRELSNQAAESCPLEGALNWLTTQLFLTHFRLDQKDRKVMIEEIYNQTLKKERDLDGQLILDGAKNVFYSNLSHANKENVKNLTNYSLTDFNSFESKSFDEIFKKLNVLPILQFTDAPSGDYRSRCDQNLTHNLLQDETTLDDFINKFADNGGDIGSLTEYLNGRPKQLFQFNHEVFEHEDPLRELTLSFYKVPQKILYYGLQAEFDYGNHQLFSLTTDKIKFKGSAFAKPFGGTFGPQPNQSDPFIPVYNENAPLPIDSGSMELALLLHQPNFSRWPGDRWGLVDFKLHENYNQGGRRNERNFLNKHDQYEENSTGIKRVYTIEDYFHLILHEGKADDPLARGEDQYNEPMAFTRMMELMAVFPDLYDISYYSILANYHKTYFEKICKLLIGSECSKTSRNEFISDSGVAGNRRVYIRGDFGWPYSEDYINTINTENEGDNKVELSIAPYFLYQGQETDNPPRKDIKQGLIRDNNRDPVPRSRSARLIGRGGDGGPSHPLTQGNLFYPWLAVPLPGRLLTSWANPHPLDYDNYIKDGESIFDGGEEAIFAKCKHKVLEDGPVPSACAGIGRSGYSVKLISCETVEAEGNEYKPDDIDEYCPN